MSDKKPRKGSPRPGNGGAGRGQGRIGSIKPLRMIIMDTYPEAQDQLAAITAFRRKTGQPRVSQPAVVAALITAEHTRLGLGPGIETDGGWILRCAAEAAQLAQEAYGLAGEELRQLRAYLVDHDEDAIATRTWFILDGLGLVGPSGALLADVVSIFWRQEP